MTSEPNKEMLLTFNIVSEVDAKGWCELYRYFLCNQQRSKRIKPTRIDLSTVLEAVSCRTLVNIY